MPGFLLLSYFVCTSVGAFCGLTNLPLEPHGRNPLVPAVLREGGGVSGGASVFPLLRLFLFGAPCMLEVVLVAEPVREPDGNGNLIGSFAASTIAVGVVVTIAVDVVFTIAVSASDSCSGSGFGLRVWLLDHSELDPACRSSHGYDVKFEQWAVVEAHIY